MSARPFVLSVSAVIVDASGCCLLVRRSAANQHFVGSWEWPGGKVEPGEDFATAIVRETREETSLDIEITGLAGATQFAVANVNVVMLFLEARVLGGELHLSREHDDATWVAWKDLLRYQLPPHMQEFVMSYADRKTTAPGLKPGSA